jgi:hypothetical protein
MRKRGEMREMFGTFSISPAAGGFESHPSHYIRLDAGNADLSGDKFSLFQSGSTSGTRRDGDVGFSDHFGDTIEAYACFTSGATKVGSLNRLSAYKAKLTNTIVRHRIHFSWALSTCKHLSKRKA